jgi:high frequency lysogenization protein
MIHWFFPHYDERMALSLAGVWQSTTLANELAGSGSCDIPSYERCLRALLELDPKEDSEVFGQPGDMRMGLMQLDHFCREATPQDLPSRYAIQILQLQKILQKKPTAQEEVRIALSHAKRQADFYGLDDQNLMKNVADTYRKNLSPLLEIQIMGKHQFLEQEMVAARVRVMLFAAVRFAFLWRQSGGQTLHLLTARRRIREQVLELLK